MNAKLGSLIDELLDECERPDSVFVKRAVSAILALIVVALLISQAGVSVAEAAVVVGLALGTVLYTFWPVVTGSWRSWHR